MADESEQMLVFSVVGVLGDPQAGDPQITFHTSVARDASIDELNGHVDRVMSAMRRQKAAADILACERQIRLLQREIAKSDDGHDKREDEYVEKGKQLRERIEAARSKPAKIREDDQAAFLARGKQGEHVLSNSAKSAIAAAEKEAAVLVQQLVQHDHERAQALVQIDQVNASLKGRIADEEAEIDRLRMIVAPPPTRPHLAKIG